MPTHSALLLLLLVASLAVSLVTREDTLHLSFPDHHRTETEELESDQEIQHSLLGDREEILQW